MSLSLFAAGAEEEGAVKSIEGWTAWGSCEAARFGEEVEASDSIDSERCLLRLVVESFGVSEGELDGDGGVSIALVGCGREEEEKTEDPKQPLDTDAYSPEVPIDAHAVARHAKDGAQRRFS